MLFEQPTASANCCGDHSGCCTSRARRWARGPPQSTSMRTSFLKGKKDDPTASVSHQNDKAKAPGCRMLAYCLKRLDERLLVRLFSMSRTHPGAKGGKQYSKRERA